MRKRAIKKEFRREIKNSFQRFLSILLISALGVAFYAGLRSCKTDMLMTADEFYDMTSMMDLRVISLYGLMEEDISKIQELPSVQYAEGAFVKDVSIQLQNADDVLRVYSLTDKVNTYKVEAGRLPVTVMECALDSIYMKNHNYHVGDKIKLMSGNDEDLSETFQETELVIVGSVSTGRYMSMARGSGSLGNGKINAFIVVSKENFISDYYSEAYVIFNGTQQTNGHSAEYENLVKSGIKEIEAISLAQNENRLDDVKEKAKEELDDAYLEVKKSEEDLNQAIYDILDGEKQIEEGLEQIATARVELAEQIAGAPALFEAAQQELDLARSELDKAWKEFEKQEAPVIEARSEYNAYEEQLIAISQGPNDVKKILAMMGIFEDDIIAAEEKIEEARTELNNREKEYEAAVNSLQEKIDHSEVEFENAAKALDDKEKELKDKKKELKTARKDYYANLAENRQKISDAYAEIEEKREEVENMEVSDWYLLDRDTIEAYVGYEQDADRMDAISKVFPALFFLVAALVSLTTMTRMVDEERTQIGTMKSLGYSTPKIAGKYLKYAFYATLIGSVIGIAAGSKVFPYVIITTYKLVYTALPGVIMPIHPLYSAMAGALAVFCTTAAAFFSCVHVLREQPAALMRPVSPKPGKRILLERIGFLWKHFSFTRKATLRNMFRYKKRFFMTVIGIAGCMALLLVGFGLKDSIGSMAKLQYGNLWLQDATVTIDSSLDTEERLELAERMKEFSNVSDISLLQESVIDVSMNGEVKTINLVVLPNADAMNRFFVFRDRETKQQYPVNEQSVFVSEKVSKLLDIQEGSQLAILKDSIEIGKVNISHITENYIYNYLFMTEETYRKLYNSEPDYQEVFLKLSVKGIAAEEQAASSILKEFDEVKSISVTSTFQKKIDDMLQSLNVITYVLIICAGLLAFVVLYNLSNINITERKRELATLKVLGFYDGEVSGYVYRENVLLTLIGIGLGMVLGYFLHGFVITTCEVDMVMFAHVIFPISYGYSALVTVIFALFIGILMHMKLKTIDMVESMKSVD